MSREIKYFGEHKVRWVTISSDEYESMKSTLEILSDPELMQQIEESREDFKAGRYKELRELEENSNSTDTLIS
jgi:PHD/YefM family antitoxin component YafN of YafNO toxin-antitoxin module